MKSCYWLLAIAIAVLFIAFGLFGAFAHPIVYYKSYHSYTTPQYYGPGPNSYSYDSFVTPVRYPVTSYYTPSNYYPSSYYSGGVYYKSIKVKLPKPFPVTRYFIRQLDKHFDD